MSSLEPLYLILLIQVKHLLAKSAALSNVIILNSRCQTSRHAGSSSFSFSFRSNCLPLPPEPLSHFYLSNYFIGTVADPKWQYQNPLGCNILRIQWKALHTFKPYIIWVGLQNFQRACSFANHSVHVVCASVCKEWICMTKYKGPGK